MSRSEDFGKVSPAPPQGPSAPSSARAKPGCAEAQPGGAPACAVPATADRGALRPAGLSLQQAARVLAAVGARHATVENLRRDIEAGAPVNADGTVNLVHYAAWLAREAARGD